MRRPIGYLSPAFTWLRRAPTRKRRISIRPSDSICIQDALFTLSAEFGWQLRAWAILANHYHFIAGSPSQPDNLRKSLGKLHMITAKQLNQSDAQPGRKIWYQYWDSRITFEKAYLARLCYVHNNPIKHGLVANAANYRWCSAAWFAENSSPAFVKSVNSFKIDRLSVSDDF